MSDVPVSRATLKTAEPLVPRIRPRTLIRAKPLVDSEAVFAGLAAVGFPRPADLGSIVIQLDTTTAVAATPLLWSGLAGSASFFSGLGQIAAQEAPAWAISVVVHMVTLVTMAMVTMPDPVSYKARQLIVTPPEEEKLEQIKEAKNEQPTSVNEGKPDGKALEAVAFESKLGHSKLEIEPSEEPEAAPAPVDLTDFGLEHVPKSDLLTVVGVYGGMGLAARGVATKAQLVMREGGSDSSEKSVATALRWLANHQLHDGSWSFNHGLAPTCRGQCRNLGSLPDARNGATGMALLPFLGSGQTHIEGRYRATIRRGLSYLVDHMRIGAQGGAMNETGGNLYSHGLASIALCEAYAMTHDENLMAPAQKALDFISYAQDPVGGGWRYKPREKGDTSVVGWQLMALKSGHMANLRVLPLTVHRASLFLDSVASDDGAAYGYTDAKSAGEATTAIGLLSRMYLGWKKDNSSLQRGVKFLGRHGPSGANMYYNYYATQVMRHWEGDEWANWNRQMRDQLVHAQAKQGHEDGSWFSGTGDSGTGPGGRLYCTAMATMILEVYYRHLPIYRAQSVDQDFPE
jgi:hypothetical protein